MTDQKKDRKKT